MRIKLHGQIVTLRPPILKDAADMYEGARDISVARNTFVPHPYRLKDAVDFIKSTLKRKSSDNIIGFGIIDNESGKLVGMIGLQEISKKHKRAEVGYWLNKKYRKRGFTSEALRLVLDYCFTKLKLERVVSGTLTGSDISRHLLLKAGFKEEGCLRRHIKHHGRWKDLYRYGLLKSEWKSKKRKQL